MSTWLKKHEVSLSITTLIIGGVFLILALLSSAVWAADSLATIADNVRGNLDETLKLGTSIVFVIGFLLVAVGCFLIWRMGRHQGAHSPATLFTCIAAVVAGVLMVYHSTVVGVGGATMFGSSEGDITVEGTTEVR